MEAKLISLLSLLLLLLSSALADREPSPFNFINGLEGYRMGNSTKGIHELKHYLAKFGYLQYNYSDHHAADNDEFDDLLEEATKTYQRNYHLKVTGALDSETVTLMRQPRCGVPDIINGSNLMMLSSRPSHRRRHHHHGGLHAVERYTIPNGRPRRPSNKYHLTYSFFSGTPHEAKEAVDRAFKKWASISPFTFSQTLVYRSADLKIAFARGDHGEGHPFDVPGGIVAHAALPTGGYLHSDQDDRFADGAVPGTLDYKTVALHEIGHMLALGHNSVSDAIMFAMVPDGATNAILAIPHPIPVNQTCSNYFHQE